MITAHTYSNTILAQYMVNIRLASQFFVISFCTRIESDVKKTGKKNEQNLVEYKY